VPTQSKATNRVTVTLDPHGQIIRVCSDEEIEFFTVAPHVPHDRVYRYGAVEVGPQFVREEIGGYAVGHAADGTLSVGLPISPKLPPSKPAIRTV
jgi:hypothetical protein